MSELKQQEGLEPIKDSDLEQEVDFGRTEMPKDLESEIDILRLDSEPGHSRGLKWLLTSKNSYNPGHSHILLPTGYTMIHSYFESKDGWTTGGVGTPVITPFIGGLSLATSGATNDDAYAIAMTTGFNSLDVSQTSLFQSVLKLSGTATITAYWGVGDLTNGGLFGGAAEEGYGFKYVNGTLSACTRKNGAETLTTITGITATNLNEYRAVYEAPNGVGKGVTFFINDKMVARHTANLMDTDDDVFATFYVKTGANAARTLYSRYLYFAQLNP